MLLIITNKNDLACDFLILRLRERGINYKRLNMEDLTSTFDVTITLRSSGLDFGIEFVDGLSADAHNTSAVYFRQPTEPSFLKDVVAPHRSFARREVLEFYRSLWRVIDERRWLNHPKKLWLAGNKVEQLALASRLGFDIPDTLVSSSHQAVAHFAQSNEGKVIAKAVRHGFMREDGCVQIATTQRLTSNLIDSWDRYGRVPVIVQREIPKIHDIRVTVVGDHIFATAIYSQEHDVTRLDWRLWDVCDVDLRHEAIELPHEVADRCLEMTREYELGYAAIDMIYSTDHRYYFLELNPNGQWVWIEQLVGYQIRDAIIEVLRL